MAAQNPMQAPGLTQATYPDAFPERNPLDRLRIYIADEISRILDVEKTLVFGGLDRAASLDSGDLLLAVPRLRIQGIKPGELAVKIASQFDLRLTSGQLKKPIADGIYVRFFIETKYGFNYLVPDILHESSQYGFNTSSGLLNRDEPTTGRKRMIVEFSSPNIAKRFHAGHVRSAIIGNFLSNLYEVSGYEVIRMNYLGDWGRQYGLLACGWKRYGDEDAFVKDPIGHLLEIYVKICADFEPEDKAYAAARDRGEDTAMLESQGVLGEAKANFKGMEDGDEEALKLWRKFRALSIENFKETYARLNISFTVYSGESGVLPETMEMAESVQAKLGLTEPFDGATCIDFKKHGAPKLSEAIVRNRNGTTSYLLRDIGAAIQREKEYSMDEMLYVVMNEQDVHLNRLFKSLELMGGEYTALSKKMKHITFGRVAGMSSRKGNVKFLDELITEVAEYMHNVMRKNNDKYEQIENPEQVAEHLGISAILVQDMSGKKIHDYDFDLERMTSFEGDTGPYLQYAHARLASIFRRIDITPAEMLNADFSSLENSTHAANLLRIMMRWPDMVAQTLKTLEANTILTYLFKLAHELSASYDHLRVVNPPEGRAVSAARAALYKAAQQVLRNGMGVLGLTPVDRM
ncbi:hypothetical protein NLG97_g1758 [Lecanicillium saksenae]|uniref:Uncharacterized protein n=1 Tax=Lecanicillium saksenae TaxID=468837 RepID=A0ACC1R4Q9_9HYPO|nr:hypothetical protein NLG97_g1758 [Lecanicillium saksenae]